MRNYAHILTFSIKHTYYTDRRCTDLQIESLPATEEIIKNFRLIVKYRPAGLDTYAPLSDGKLLIPLENCRLKWLLKPSSNLFYSITDLPPKPPKSIYQITNQQNSWCPENFEHSISLNQETNTLSKSFGLMTGMQFQSCWLVKSKKPQRITLNRPCATETIEDFSFEKVNKTNEFHPSPEQWELVNNTTLSFNAEVTKTTGIRIHYPVLAKTGGAGFALLDLQLDDIAQEEFAQPADTGETTDHQSKKTALPISYLAAKYTDNKFITRVCL